MRAIFILFMIPSIILLEDSNVLAKANANAYPSEDVIIFNATGQPGGLVDADKTIDINVKSGPKDWIVRYQALTLNGNEGEITPDRISVNNPYTNGYEEMSVPRVLAKGDDKVTRPVAIGPVRFRLQTTWKDKPGTYTGLLISPDGAQSIHVKLIINPFTSILLDPPSVYFDALGHPSVFDAVSEVAVKVSSNYAGWTVSCKAAPLSLAGRGNNTIPNERIFYIIDKDTPLKEAFSATNKRLAETLEGLIDTIASAGLINIDFADLKSVLEGRGRLAYLHSVMASGPTKAQEAVSQVLANPLCTYSIDGVDRMLFNIVGDKGLRMQEVASISAAIAKYNPKARIILGVTTSGGLKGRVRITLFTTGCKADDQKLFKFKKKKIAKPKVQPKKVKKNGKAVKPKASKTPPLLEPEPQSTEQEEATPEVLFPAGKSRRNALDLQRAVDQEVQDLEQKEKEWDPPAFLQK